MYKTDKNDAPLPLSELKRWISEDVFSWIQQGDEKQEKLKKELEENSAFNSDDESTANRRVQEWSSSSIHPDGIGGFRSLREGKGEECDDSDGGTNEHAVKIVCTLSESYQGFGDTLWSSARHIANVLANPTKCREILAPMLSRRGDGHGDDDLNRSPLHGTSCLEAGAGAGVPSWASIRCGARVVCTDLSDTNRIRSMRECAERNFRQMEARGVILHGEKTRVCPYDWGSPIDGVARALNENGHERFDVIIAADCCYMPWLHAELLDSIDMLLSDKGVALVPFALHGNTEDDDVLKIVDRAKDKGFVVKVLQSQQLSPPTSVMDSKQGLIRTVVRLTKPT